MAVSQHLLHGLLAVISGILIAEPGWMWKPHFFKAVGEACVIALLVIYLVEVQSHKRLEETAAYMISKVGKSIFGLVYGHELPPQLVEAIEQNTLQQPIYRDRMRLDIELLKAELPRADGAQEEICRLTNTYRYTLVNCSKDDPVNQTIQVSLERDKWLAEIIAGKASDPAFEYVRVGDLLFAAADKVDEIRKQLSLGPNIAAHTLSNHCNWGGNGNELVFRLDNIPIPPEGRLDIAFKGVLFKRNSDNEVWSTSFPTLGVTLSATSIDFEVEARFPADGVASTSQTTLLSRWGYDSPLLAGQSVIYWWRPKKA